MTVRRPLPRVRASARATGLLVTLGLIAAGCGSLTPTAKNNAVPGGQPSSAEVAFGQSRYFMSRFVAADGRVVRADQGGDTVSEGQAYALLMAVALDRSGQFGQVWSWTRAHLQRPDGLLSWHWVAGKVVDPSPATDADLDAARALYLAAAKFHNPAYLQQSRHMASSILSEETVVTEGSRILVAGPWARHVPYVVNPSYSSPVTFGVLAAATHDPAWTKLTDSGNTMLASLSASGTRLPPNWASVSASGSVSPLSFPSGTPIQFGDDAFRTVLRSAEACNGASRRLASADWVILSRQISGAGPAQSYRLDGTPATSGRNAVLLAAEAAAAEVAGHTALGRSLVGQLARAARNSGSYYLTAWSALSGLMLSTRTLGGCPVGSVRSPSGVAAPTASAASQLVVPAQTQTSPTGGPRRAGPVYTSAGAPPGCVVAAAGLAGLAGRDLRVAPLPARLDCVDLAGADLVGRDMSGRDLRHTNLGGANLSDTNLTGANLAGADLSGANLTRTAMAGANLSGSDLRGALLARADLARADFEGADLRGARLAGAQLLGVDLVKAQLAGVDLSHLDLIRADLSGADMAGVDLVGSDLVGAHLRSSVVSGVSWFGATCPDGHQAQGGSACTENQ